MCKCSAKIIKDVAPMFVVQSAQATPLDNRYATVQFIARVEVTYNSSHRIFQPTEIIQLPYPVIYDLYTASPQEVSFRKPKEEMIFREVYGMPL